MNRRRRLPAAFLFRFTNQEQAPFYHKQKRNIDGQKAKQENVH